METTIDKEKVRERVSEYIANQGYARERTFSPSKLDICFVSNGGHKQEGFISMPLWTAILPTAPAHNFLENMKVLKDLQELFKPVGKVYLEGKRLYARASTLTPKYAQISQENQKAFQNLEKAYQCAVQERQDIETKHRGLKRWWLSRKNESIQNFFKEVLHYSHTRLPQSVSRDVGLSALFRLYDWLQVGEEDSDSQKAREDLVDSSSHFTRGQRLLLGVEGDLYKIKNHTAIVCLDQLRQDGLTLDGAVSQEMDRVPREYLQDVFYWNENVSAPFRLRTEHPNSFGAGLYKQIL